MRVMVLYNPVSGKGRGSVSAGAISKALLRASIDVELVPTEAEDARIWLTPRLMVYPDAVVVVGGDGTLRQVASVFVSTGVPVFHAPSGTENLFATSMGMSSDPEDVVASVQGQVVTSIDTAEANGTFMLLMASVGFDAAIVKDLSISRGYSITHMSYVMPFIRQLLRWDPPEISIQVDGKQVVDATRGWAIIANSCAYALGVNPAQNADMKDGMLDVVFLPFKARWQALVWVIRLMRGTHAKHRDSVVSNGERVVVQSSSEACWQLDGDPFDCASEMVIECKPNSLVVLQQAIAVDDSACDCIDGLPCAS